jgi:hypothetical protein
MSLSRARWLCFCSAAWRCGAAGKVCGTGLCRSNHGRSQGSHGEHGQSQGICDLLGASVARQPGGNFFVHPVAGDTAAVDRIRPRPLRESMYWGAVEWIRHARHATQGQFPFRNPVMVGPFDLCSECRSLVAAAMFEEFDAPYLRRIGQALGPYGIHPVEVQIEESEMPLYAELHRRVHAGAAQPSEVTDYRI